MPLQRFLFFSARIRRIQGWLILGHLTALAAPLPGQPGGDPIHWETRFSAACRASARSGGAPILFISPASRSSSKRPEAHPLLAEAVNQCFVPLKTDNAETGSWKLLKYTPESRLFRLPADSAGPLLDLSGSLRFPSDSAAPFLEAALLGTGRPVPPYLHLLSLSVADSPADTLVFFTPCLSLAQAFFGSKSGVLEVQTGKMDSIPAVSVQLDTTQVPVAAFLDSSCELTCLEGVCIRRSADLPFSVKDFCLPVVVCGLHFEPQSTENDMPLLRRHPWLSRIPMFRLQALRVNSALELDPRQALSFLSPRQRAVALRLKERQNRYAGPYTGCFSDSMAIRLNRMERNISTNAKVMPR